MKKHLYIILLILPLIGFGQGWEQTFGGGIGDCGYSVQQTTDGGYIITGRSFGTVLLKTDENGEQEWSQNFDGTDTGHSVQQTTDGGYIILMTTNTGFSCLLKTDENGEEEWSQIFTSSLNFDSVQQMTDGGYVLYGFDYDTYDLCLLKTDENGEEESFITIVQENGYLQNIIGKQTLDGGYVVVSNTGNSVLLLKTDENGEEEWSQYFSPIYSMLQSISIEQSLDGGYIIMGSLWLENSYNEGWDFYLLKTDENGEEEWSQNFGGTDTEFLYSGQQTSDGGYISCGSTGSFGNGGSNDVYLLKTDGNGIEQWSQTFGGPGSEGGHSVQQTLDGGYIIVGGKQQESGGKHLIYLIKTNEFGNITSTIELPTPTSKRELIKTTNILGQENTTIKNQPLIEIYDDGSVDKKYIIE